MARVRSLEPMAANVKVHPTEVDCGYQIVQDRGDTLLQLSTYGSDQRQSEKKVSQTLQFDRDRASQLLRVIQRAFPGL
jgi:5-methylcytosine-specific restriction protein B